MEDNMGNQKPRPEVSQRLWMVNEVGLRPQIKSIKVTGKENIKEIPPDAKIVIMTTHLTDLDVPLAIHAVARELDVLVMNESERSLPEKIGLSIAGMSNFSPIDYRKTNSGKAAPSAFNPENFEPAKKALEAGKAVIIAAHNPSKEPLQDLKGIRGGYGGVYLAGQTDSYILPITIILDRKTGMYKNSIVKKITNKPNASVVIGKPFKLKKIPGIENMGFPQLADVLREQSQVVMKNMSDQLLAQ